LADEGGIVAATLRRRRQMPQNGRGHDEGTMCPSYMVTSEEQHSTRGRALEVIITETPAHLHRRLDAESGLPLIDPSNRPAS
jgi:hypothetical protein